MVLHVWLHVTNPYAQLSIVRQPYKTSVENGLIRVTKVGSLRAWSGTLANLAGYYKSGFLIVQARYFGGRKTKASTAGAIVAEIHRLRFDPSKPYLISGDQFSVLYARNLGVFYNALLNPNTALGQEDWECRQRIYLQSALFALDAFSAAKAITTTLVPVGVRIVALTQVHPGSVASDSVYGLLYALHALQDSRRYSSKIHQLQTTQATREVVQARATDLRMLVDLYVKQVCDPKTGMVRSGLDLASARDGALRDRSFYDMVIVWKTLKLARQLGVSDISQDKLAVMRADIIKTYWDKSEGHFRDDLTAKPANANYSSDWLIALPTGFLQPDKPEDQPYLTRSVAFIRAQGIDEPFPIKYQASNAGVKAPWAVRTFVPNYGGDAIWSYWGAQYITLLAQLAASTGEPVYQAQAIQYRDMYRRKMEQYRGFPETFTAQGDFLQNAVYKSIRQTGWVVQFEEAEWLIGENEQRRSDG